jgi:hypothetical protein
MARPTIAVFEIAKFLKGDSSKWIHQEFSHMKGSVGRTVMGDSR